MDNFEIDVIENDGEVLVQDNEFTIIGDSLYSSTNAEEAPDWLKAIVENVVDTRIATGFNDYDALVEDVRNAVLSIDSAKNTFIEQVNFEDMVNGIIGSHLETLNASYDGKYATKIELDTVASNADYALAQSISDLSSSMNEQISATATSITNTMATNQSAISEDITTLATVLDGNSAAITQTMQSIDGIEASWSIDTDVNGHVAGIKLINSVDTPSKFIVSTDVFEVRNATTGDVLIGTVNEDVVVSATAVGGIPASEVLSDLNGIIMDFDTQNNRLSTPIQNPVILSNGTAIDHVVNTDGSVDISFEWTWTGEEADIDGFVVVHYKSQSSSSYTFGTNSALETTYQVPAYARSFVFTGVSADSYHTFGVIAYRKVDSDISSNGVITSSTIKPSLSSEDPYQPSSTVAFSGNIVGTIVGYSASSVRSNAYAGATFTSSNAGNLAYEDQVSTVHIANLAVNRLKIADESAGILKYTYSTNFVYGNGGEQNVLNLSVYTPEAANCFLQISLQQDYNLANYAARSGVRLKKNGSSQFYRPIGVVNDTPCISMVFSLPAGTTSFAVDWYGETNEVAVANRTISAYVSLR